jgi:outer membrane receptor for ferrienterochelin and colicins
LAGLLASLVFNASGLAQSLDYGAYEQVFGEPITESATGKPQRASDAPANIEIITQDDIRRSGATSIPDVLQFVAGVDVRRYGMADVEVGIRGYNQPYNPRLLVLVNGRQVYQDDYSHVSWLTIPVQLAEIRQIEVIKGPSSALYGFNAVSGVINIITYDPLHDKINTATLHGGTQDYLGGSAVATGQIGDSAGLRLSLGGFHSREFAPAGLDAVDVALRQPPFVGAFNADGKVRLAPGVEGYAEVSVTDSRVFEKDYAGDFDTAFSRTNSFRIGVSGDSPIGQLGLSAYRNAENVSLDLPGIQLANWVQQAVYVVQASDLLKLGTDHAIRIGLEYRNNSLTAPGFVGGTIGYDVYAASLMWDWQITPRVSLTNAVRVDTLQLNYQGSLVSGTGNTVAAYNASHFTEPSFNTGLVFNVTSQDTLRLMLARGVQVPSLADFGVQIPAGQLGPVIVAGNPNLSPSIVRNVELDYDRTIPAIDSTLRVAVFAQSNDELISQALGVPPVIGPAGLPVLMSGNVGNSNAAGAELGVRGHSQAGFRWNASYAFVATTDNTVLNQGPLPTSAVTYARSVPRNVINLGVGYTRDRWEMDLLGRWQSSYEDFRATAGSLFLQPVEVTNYVTLNARIGYRVTDNLTLSVVAQQFNVSQLLQTAGPPVERQILAGVTVRF